MISLAFTITFRIPGDWKVRSVLKNIVRHLNMGNCDNYYLWYPAKQQVLEESKLFQSYNLDPSRLLSKVKENSKENSRKIPKNWKIKNNLFPIFSLLIHIILYYFNFIFIFIFIFYFFNNFSIFFYFSNNFS